MDIMKTYQSLSCAIEPQQFYINENYSCEWLCNLNLSFYV